MNRGPTVGLEKRVFKAAEHVVKHLIGHGKRQLIGFIKFAGRRVPAFQEIEVMVPTAVLACRPPVTRFFSQEFNTMPVSNIVYFFHIDTLLSN